MNKFSCLLLLVAFAILCGCQKQQTEEERNAEVDRRVQERLAAEHQAQQQQELDQRASDLAAREKALAEKEKSAEPESRDVEPARTSMPRAAEPVAAPAAASSYSIFYTKLEPYGEWRDTPDYGYVWQPNEAQRSRAWRPYTIGRWVYTDVGWMWVSEEPFGWAAYHYGRWVRLRHIGWVWVPGEEWAPAWVSWRKSDDFVGWAPLPPEARFDQRAGIHNWADNYYDIGPDQYCFVATQQFGAQRVAPTVVPSERNVSIINQTTNVTNITYNNTTIVNQGPDYQESQRRAQQPIERLRVDRKIAVNLDIKAPRPVVRGEVIEIPAPIIARPQPAERPRYIKERVTSITVDRGWEMVGDVQAAQKVRAKINSESSPPPDAPPKTFVKPVQARAETMEPPVRSTSSPASAVAPTQPPATATITPSVAPVPSATPQATRTPVDTATAIPRPTFKRRPLVNPKAAPTRPIGSTSSPEPSPHVIATPSPTIVPHPANSLAPQSSPLSSGTPSPTVTQTPGMPGAHDKQQARKEEREIRKEDRKNRKRGMEQDAERAASPSATPTP